MITQNSRLLSFLNELRKGKIHYRLDQYRDDAIMVEITVPGERWEVEFLEDGTVEVEVFRSDGTINDGASLDDLIRRHSDDLSYSEPSSRHVTKPVAVKLRFDETYWARVSVALNTPL